MPRGTAQSTEDRLAKCNEISERIAKRREARRAKYVAADLKDVIAEREINAERVRLQVTADHAAELDARIAEELAKLNGEDDGSDEDAKTESYASTPSDYGTEGYDHGVSPNA